MRSFEYHPAGSIDEVIQLLGDYGDDTQLLAGGTSLMLLNRLELVWLEHVVGLQGIAELTGIAYEPGVGLRIAAMTTLRQIETSPAVCRAVPALAQTVHEVATVRIRNQATIGGNLAHADPAQDTPPMLMALGAFVEAIGPAGPRRIGIDDLFTGYLETTLAPDEILTAVVVPPLATNVRAGYLKFLPDTEDDYATVSVAAALEVADGRCRGGRIALGAVAATPVRSPGVEAGLVGFSYDAGGLEELAALVRADIEPATDRRGSSAYKRDMAAVCVERLLQRLLEEEPT